MNLSTHFTLEEMTHSNAGERAGIDNTPSEAILTALRHTCQRMEEVRTLLGGVPIHVSSGYRCPALNELVGGVHDSAHLDGYAVDFICPDLGAPLDVARVLAGSSSLKFDQIIREYGWVHISFAPAERRELLTKRAKDSPYEEGLVA